MKQRLLENHPVQVRLLHYSVIMCSVSGSREKRAEATTDHRTSSCSHVQIRLRFSHTSGLQGTSRRVMHGFHPATCLRVSIRTCAIAGIL